MQIVFRFADFLFVEANLLVDVILFKRDYRLLICPLSAIVSFSEFLALWTYVGSIRSSIVA